MITSADLAASPQLQRLASHAEKTAVLWVGTAAALGAMPLLPSHNSCIELFAGTLGIP
jgi:hypothetical protein